MIAPRSLDDPLPEVLATTFFLHPSTLAGAAHVLIVFAITLRVIMRRPTTGVALAWLCVVALVPFGGAVLYLLIGERRISHQRARGIDELRSDYKRIAEAAIHAGLTDVDWSRHAPIVRGMNLLGQETCGAPRFVYEPEFAETLRALQQTYIDDADRIDPQDWASRSFKERFLENTFRLMSPLL